VPGESRGGVRGTGRRQSRLARGSPRESNRDQCRRETTGVKRAILPAAISESAASRLLAEAGRREPPRRRRRGRSLGTERDDHQEQNSAYSPTLLSTVPIAQSAERLSVEQEVAGSCPARHPRKSTRSSQVFRGGRSSRPPRFRFDPNRDPNQQTIHTGLAFRVRTFLSATGTRLIRGGVSSITLPGIGLERDPQHVLDDHDAGGRLAGDRASQT
jgi:hypothetical protein